MCAQRAERAIIEEAASVAGSTRSDFLPPNKALFCHSPRASRRIPASEDDKSSADGSDRSFVRLLIGQYSLNLQE
jgi:hypothetical protein